MMKRILALDLGTSMGAAFNFPADHPPTAITHILGTAKEIAEWGKTRFNRRLDPRVTRMFTWVWQALTTRGYDILIFEDVCFSSSTQQTQLWSSFRGALWCAASMVPRVSVECVHTGTLKKFATGHGGATKEMMASSLYRLSPQWKSANLSDDAVDALWLWQWAKQHLM
jgi:Holliday junction resolvasome RuvABC endonuclease subunit